MPSRYTFASALQASALCVSAALRHPGSACSHSPLESMGNPSQSNGGRGGRRIWMGFV